MAMSGRISVVVPAYNVAAYLEDCLESLAQQTFGDLEVVVVDDGSTDESAEIADRFAARDPRFRLVQQENAGLGAARNTGAHHVSGEFVAFVDSDDLVPRHAYELLVNALDETGSDFASGNVCRLTPLGTEQARFLAKTFKRTRLGTHITRFPLLLADRTAWNKLFRRSFWEGHGLKFPVGVYYEDTPVTLPAHYLATSVDVLEQTVYLWRMREGPDLSITQRRTESKTLRDRVAAVDHVSRFLAEQGLWLSKAAYDRTVVSHDLRFFLEVLPRADDEFRRLFLDLANDFFDRANDWALDQPFAIDRLKWELVRRRALPELLEVLRFEDEDLADTPPVREGRSWYGDYPYRNDARLSIPRRTFRLGDELAAVFRLNDVRWQGEALKIEGYAYIDSIGAPTADAQTVQLHAERRGLLRRRLALKTEPVCRPDVTAAAFQRVAGLDWTGFLATLDVSRLKPRGRWQDGTWEITATIRAQGLARASRHAEAASLRPIPAVELPGESGARVRAGLGPSGKLIVEVQCRPTLVSSAELDGRVVVLYGEVGPGTSRNAKLQVSRSLGAVTLEYPVYVDRSSRPATFLARVPVDDLIRELDTSDEIGHVEQHASGVVWHVALAEAGRVTPLALSPSVPEPTWTVEGREITLSRAPGGAVCLTEGLFRPVVTGAAWSPEGTLALEGTFRGPDGEYDLVVTARTLETLSVPLALDTATGRFEAELAPAAMDSPAGKRPLPEGVWTLSVRRRGEARPAVEAVVGEALLDELPLSTANGLERFHLGVETGDAVALAVERDLEAKDRGGFHQRRLRTAFYPAERARGLLDVVVYDCFGGREYADSPRAIHEELVRRGAPLEHLWIVRNGAFQLPETAVAVRHGSREHYEALARARYVVGNDYFPRWFRRRPDQVCLQTWHGSPLKLLGYALVARPKALRAYRRALAEGPENWQCVVSPGAFATPILERAFPVGEAFETGLPRTDLLVRPDRESVAEDVRRRLGLDGKKVVLYAPTYRDHLFYRPGRRPGQLRDLPTYAADFVRKDGYRLGQVLDASVLKAALGDDYAVLFRKHRKIVDALPDDPSMVDVSSFPDATELLLAADVLVTDYSSAVFDFAVTGRPIVFFTPDLDDYRDEIRGFSIDFEADAPGPLLRTTEEVVEALQGLDAVHDAYAERYGRFVERYCPLSDGAAAARIVEAVFRS
jgi:CDP-glycerol glycerophosphotransferase